MNLAFLAPSFFAVLVIASMGLHNWRLRPRFAIPLLTSVMVVAASVTTLMVVATSVAFLVGPARASALFGWCSPVPLHHEVNAVEGIAATILAAVVFVRVVSLLAARRRVMRSLTADRIQIVESPRPFAYAVPRNGGRVVVSTTLLDELTPTERTVVFAHERAHLRHHHHIYLAAAGFAEAALPLLGRLGKQLRHATERAADESAVEALGGDRQVVATAVARAGVTNFNGSSTLPAFGAGSVVDRVQSLLWPEKHPDANNTMTATAVALGVGAAIAVGVQLHHYSALIDHLCQR